MALPAEPPRRAADRATDPGDRLRFQGGVLGVPGGPQPGERWGRFAVEGLLGEGGMGQVFLAEDPVLRRKVALKVVLGHSPRQAERFLAEARAQARVEHEGVCRVYEVGEVDGRPYIAMQYIAGPSLRQLPATLSLEQRVELVRAVALAVHAAHKTGLIHRDLKPSNILLEESEQGWRPYVTDFGIARAADEPGLTRTGHVQGTLEYLPPEVARGTSQEPDRRLDVWGLGATLYEVLTGRLPYEAASDVELFGKLLAEAPVPLGKRRPDLPRDLATVVDTALAADPRERYDSARALADDLGRFLDGEPILAKPPTAFARARAWLRRNQRLAAVVGVASALVLALAGLWLRERLAAAERAELARRFGREVEAMEGRLRVARLLPLHDTSEARADVRRRMAAIEREQERVGGRAVRALAAAALGRAHLALDEPQEARAALERARADGDASSETTLALGQALGELYRRQLEQASHLADANQAARYREEAVRALRTPALALLREAATRGGNEPSRLETAQLAFYDGQHERAAAGAKAALEAEPARYEAAQLVGDAEVALGLEHFAAGRTAEARARFAAAGEAFARALEIARSDAPLLARECQRRVHLLSLDLLEPGPLPALEPAVVPCAQALVARPDASEPHLAQALAHWRLADAQGRRGIDPRPELERAVTAAERAAERNPASPIPLNTAATAEIIRAEYELSRGLDAGPALDRGIALLEQALARAPGWAPPYNELGLARWSRANLESARGGDPLPQLERGIASLERAIALNPSYAEAFNNLSLLHDTRADHRLGLEQDDAGDRQAAIAAAERAVAINPSRALFWMTLGNGNLKLGASAKLSPAERRPRIEAAIPAYEKALGLEPSYALARSNLGYAHCQLGELDVQDGTSPLARLERCRQASREALALAPDLALAHAVLGSSWLQQARWEIDQGRPGGARALAEARRAFAGAYAVNRHLKASLAPLEAQVAELEARLR